MFNFLIILNLKFSLSNILNKYLQPSKHVCDIIFNQIQRKKKSRHKLPIACPLHPNPAFNTSSFSSL